MGRVIPLVIAAMLCATPARAEIPCFIVQQYVQQYGLSAVIHWARQHGYSEKEIRKTVHRCR